MIKKVLSVLIIIAILGGAVFIYNKLPKPVKPESITLDIQGKVNEIGELATAEYVYTISESLSKDGLVILGKTFSTNKVVYSYSGTVKAGVIFSDIKIDVNNDRKQIFISIPDAKILSNELDLNSLNIISEERSLFNKITFEDVNTSQQDCKNKAESTAITRGLLNEAECNAKKIIESMVSGFFEEEYTIFFE